MLYEYRLSNDRSDAAQSCKSHQGDDQMDGEDENAAHAASYQIQKTQRFEPTEQFARDR
jgi:hypothetical protein